MKTLSVKIILVILIVAVALTFAFLVNSYPFVAKYVITLVLIVLCVSAIVIVVSDIRYTIISLSELSKLRQHEKEYWSNHFDEQQADSYLSTHHEDHI